VRVVIADDSKVILNRLTQLVSELDQVEVVGEAETGAQAIESIVRLEPDVVILDIRMPQPNGIGVLEAIKRANPNIVVIMLTNYPYPQHQKRCANAGADFFLDKSGQFDEIPEILTELLRQQRSTREG
jgi:DNA-binding NarL/FixJ family response regulator